MARSRAARSNKLPKKSPQVSSTSQTNISIPSKSQSEKNFFLRSVSIPVFVILLLVILFGFLIYKAFSNSTSSDSQVELQKPRAQETVNKTYNFPLNDENGNQVSQFAFTVQNVELRDQILIKGQKATAVQGRTFLIVNLKITNNYEKSVQLNTRDFLRLVVNNSPEHFAPEVHNDPVEVQAISTKLTRVGFPIDTNYKSLVLQVGEINGPKQTIKLNLK